MAIKVYVPQLTARQARQLTEEATQKAGCLREFIDIVDEAILRTAREGASAISVTGALHQTTIRADDLERLLQYYQDAGFRVDGNNNIHW